MIDTDLRDRDLAGILEPSDVGVIGNSVGIIAVDPNRGAGAVGDRGYAALPVGKQMMAAGCGHRAAVIPDQRIVDAVAVDVT